MMPRLSWVAASMLLLAACESQPCPEERRADLILGGGLPLCLGEDFGQLSHFRGIERDSLSSLPMYSFREEGVRYRFYAGGGVDLIFIQPFARLEQVCATAPDTATAATIAASVRRGLKGEWVMTDSSQRSWRVDDFVVKASEHTTCVRLNPAGAEGDDPVAMRAHS